MNNRSQITGTPRTLVIFLNKLILGIARHWKAIAISIFVLVLATAILAPALMTAGYYDAAQSIYHFYTPHDHQLPQRSYFLFGQNKDVQSWSLALILTQGADPNDLRSFKGNAEIGYKTALNHRMLAIFTGLLIGALVWTAGLLRPRVDRLLLGLLALPMMLDAIGHMVSERIYGLSEVNLLLVLLTGNVFSPTAYNATTIGSLNWWLRTLTGLLFGLETSWYLAAYFEKKFDEIIQEVKPNLRRIGAIK
jgi:uncharacterized membrane protein